MVTGGGAAFHNPLCPVPIKRCCHAYGQELTGRFSTRSQIYTHTRTHGGFSLRKRSSRGLMQEETEEEEEEEEGGREGGGPRFDWGASGPLDVPAIIGPGYLQPYTARSRTREYVSVFRRVRGRTEASDRGMIKGESEIDRERYRGGEVWLCKCARILAACVIIAIVNR